jgi:peroxiredoxin
MIWLGTLSVLVAVLLLAVITLTALVFALTRQLGRTLIRLEALEEAVAQTHDPPGGPTRPEGLPVGAVIPAFELPTLEGSTLSALALEGQRVLLVHWSPDCGFCRDIAGDLAAQQEDLRRRRTDLILLSHGDRERNQRLADEHGLRCRIVLDGSPGAAAVFGTLGTPAAYLLDEKGRVAKPLALGALEVPALAREVATGRRQLATERPLSESRIERDGIKAGTAAPSFALPDIDGRRVDLAEYRGRRVLLVFSDPECGPCEALMPDLVARKRDHGDELAVIMVSRGDASEDRSRRDRYGAGFPIVVQRGWTVSKQYGIFATPVAFLIGPNGVLEQDVARGGAEILRLADAAVARREEVSTG